MIYNNSVTVALSQPLFKALANGNSGANDWFGSIDLTPTMPSGDGVYPAGHGGAMAADRLLLLPYCDGPAGASFSVRVFGWYFLSPSPAQQGSGTWIPALLAEIACTSCERAGATLGALAESGSLRSTERMCDTIALTQGMIGTNGQINSTGPGTDLIASVKLDLAGCRFFQFDFKNVDQVACNCLWAKA